MADKLLGVLRHNHKATSHVAQIIALAREIRGILHEVERGVRERVCGDNRAKSTSHRLVGTVGKSLGRWSNGKKLQKKIVTR